MGYINLKIVEIRWRCCQTYGQIHWDLSLEETIRLFVLALWQATAYPNLRELTYDFVGAKYLHHPFITSSDLDEDGPPINVPGQDRIQRLVIRGLSKQQLWVLLHKLDPYVAGGGSVGTTTSQFALLVRPPTGIEPVPATPILWRIKPMSLVDNARIIWKERYGDAVKELPGSMPRDGVSVKFLEDHDSQPRADRFPFIPYEWEYGYVAPAPEPSQSSQVSDAA